MKKKLLAFFTALTAFVLSGGLTCLADVIDPGPIPMPRDNNIVPYIAIAVIAVIVIAVIILIAVKKSKTKKK